MKYKIDKRLIESYFLINRDEQEFFNRVKQGEQVALLHLCMTHMHFEKRKPESADHFYQLLQSSSFSTSIGRQ